MKNIGRVLLNSYLKKRSNLLHIWNTRLCVLTENYFITYKEIEKKEWKITNSVYISECTNIQNSDKFLNKDYSFELTHKDKSFYFICNDRIEQLEWINEIQNAIINHKIIK